LSSSTLASILSAIVGAVALGFGPREARKGRRSEGGVLPALPAAWVLASLLCLAYALQALGMSSFYDGAQGDNRYQLAIVHRVQLGDFFGDYFYRGVRSHYPPLYFWIVGTAGRLLRLRPELTLRWMPLVSILLFSLGVAAIAKKIRASASIALLLTGVVGSFGSYYLFSYPPDRALWSVLVAKPQQALGALLCLAVPAVFAALEPGGRRVLTVAALLAVAVLTMPIFVPVAGAGMLAWIGWSAWRLRKSKGSSQQAKGGSLAGFIATSVRDLGLSGLASALVTGAYWVPVIAGFFMKRSAGGYIFWQSLATLDPTHWTVGFGFGIPLLLAALETSRLARCYSVEPVGGEGVAEQGPGTAEAAAQSGSPSTQRGSARTQSQQLGNADRRNSSLLAEEAILCTTAVAWLVYLSAYLTYPLFGWSYFSWWVVVVAAVGTCLLASRFATGYLGQVPGIGTSDNGGISYDAGASDATGGKHADIRGRPDHGPRGKTPARLVALSATVAFVVFALSWNARTDDYLAYAKSPIDTEFATVSALLQSELTQRQSFVGGQEELVISALSGRGLVYVAHAFYANPLADNTGRRAAVLDLLSSPDCQKVAGLAGQYDMEGIVLSHASRWIPRVASSTSIGVVDLPGAATGDTLQPSPGAGASEPSLLPRYGPEGAALLERDDLVFDELVALGRGDPARVSETLLYKASSELRELPCLRRVHNGDSLEVLLVDL
jgi:hypothetical protein